MKHIHAFIVGSFTMALLCVYPGRVVAQCVSPSLYFELPVLISGTAGSVNSVYKFDAVTAGVDAYITVTNIVGGATLTSMDDNVFGYPAAWQPVVKTPVVQSAGESYINFRVEFKNASDGLPFTFPCFLMACIDVDGDNDRVREFVAANGHESYAISNTTTLTITNEGDLLKAAGSFNNYPGIDTSAYVTNINYNYANTASIAEVRLGNITAATFYDQNRYSCIYFKPVSMGNYYVLPAEYLNLKSRLTPNAVALNWTTLYSTEQSRFQIERSYDGTNFIIIAEQRVKLYTNNITDYSHQDLNAVHSGNKIVYYRVRQTFAENNFIYSQQVSVVLPASGAEKFSIITSPNPFTENITLSFTSPQGGSAEVKLINALLGAEVARESFIVIKGNNIFRLRKAQDISPGMYVLQLYLNGLAVTTQKLLKY